MSLYVRSLPVKCIDRPDAHEKRHRACLHCDIEYCDVSARMTFRTCSPEHAYAYGAAKRKANGSYERTDEQNEQTRQALLKFHAENDSCTPEDRAIRSERMKQTWREGKIDTSNHWTKTPEAKRWLSEKYTGVPHSVKSRMNMSRGQAARVRSGRELHTSGNGGVRADLERYFRSNWEANFARVMNLLGKQWEYESQSFQLTETLSYTPDFRIDGEFYELKGRMTERCQKQISLFREQNPNIVLHVIEIKQYDLFRKQYKHLIPNWEGK